VHAAGLITPSDYVRITSTAAAQIYNIYPRKGRIAAGSDADVILLDPRVNHTISAATHHSRLDTNVYEGAHGVSALAAEISTGCSVLPVMISCMMALAQHLHQCCSKSQAWPHSTAASEQPPYLNHFGLDS
jgi:hypothetical protein